MEILTSVITLAAEVLIPDGALGLIKETYSSIRDVNEDVDNLSKKLSDIKYVIIDAENKQVNNPQLEKWVDEVKEAAYDAEDLLETFAAEANLWKKRQITVKDNEFSFFEHTRHVSLLGKDVKQPMLAIVKNAPKLRTLLLPNGHMENFGQALDKVFHTLKYMRGVVNTQDEATENSVLEGLEPHSNLKKLQILHYGGNEFPAWMREGGLQNLVSLTLNGCLKCKTLALGDRLPNLRDLYIKGMQELEKWEDVECYSLRLLKLSNCPKLRELPEIFPYLDYLKIKRCNSLRALPVVPYLQILILIDNLILEDWHEVNLVMEVENDQGQPETTRRPSLIEVSELKVISCPKLQALPLHFNPKKLEIHGCDLLAALPPPHQAQRLEHLALNASHDGALVRAMLDPSSLNSLVISNIFSLPQWPRLPGLKALYIRDCKHLVFLSDTEEGSLRTLTFLKLLSIRNCEKLETLNEELPTSLECLTIASCPLLKSFSLNNLPSLTDLYIEDCPLLQSLPEDGLPSSLQHLLIQTCPLLSQRCQKEGGGGRDWPKIEHIPDLEIDNSHIPSKSP
ncbi:hypothetical protein FH972_009878 [Carpinus fangiana]|uniref:Uncharacterized protein n=1 Tax=Carpinus fangiana TaxID=176857 RepID=A0A660KLJ9_9ROSI|nr:hypothetical protein FH972_009878 [Carpinus fangiana]